MSAFWITEVAESQNLDCFGRYWQACFWKSPNEDVYGPLRESEKQARLDLPKLVSGKIADHGRHGHHDKAAAARSRGMFFVWLWVTKEVGGVQLDIKKEIELPFAPFIGLSLEGITWSQCHLTIESVWYCTRGHYFTVFCENDGPTGYDQSRQTKEETIEWVGGLIEEGCIVDDCETVEFWVKYRLKETLEHADGREKHKSKKRRSLVTS